MVNEKIEAVLLANRRKKNTVEHREIGDCRFVFEPIIKYLRIIVDAKLNVRGYLCLSKGS